MFFILKKKLEDALRHLESDSCDTSRTTGDTVTDRLNDFYWRCGNANAVNYIRYKFGIKRKDED